MSYKWRRERSRASSSRLEEEDDDVAGSVEPAMSTQKLDLPSVFLNSNPLPDQFS